MVNLSDSFISNLGYIGYVAGAITILFSKIKNDNLNDLKQRVDILEKERDYARQQHIENQKAISNLDGQLLTYKEIPLKSIAASLDKLSVSNAEILSTLKSSAVISSKEAHEGGLLVKVKEEVKNEL